MVERMLCMYEAPGSIPGISISLYLDDYEDVVTMHVGLHA